MGTAAARFYHMLSAASATGEHEKVCHGRKLFVSFHMLVLSVRRLNHSVVSQHAPLLIGLFENYLNIRFKDPNLEAVCVGLDWMVFHDTLQQHIGHTQNYTCLAYLPYLSVAFHFLYASPSRPYVKYPHTNFEMVQKQQQNNHLLSSVMLEVPAHIRRMLNPTQLTTEMFTPVLEIITPSFRPVSTQLYTAREKQQLADLVNTMISYGLTYKQEKGPDGQYHYILDPCLEEVCRFPGLAQSKQLTYNAKQLIAREVHMLLFPQYTLNF
jgi:chromosome transmission fidelity protein 18